MLSRFFWFELLLALALGLILRPTVAADSPVSVRDGAGRHISLARPAERVIALSQGSLDIVQALGGRLVGRPSLTGISLPAELQSLPAVGNAVAPNLEAILAARPDLVIAPAQAHGDVAQRLQVVQATQYLSQARSVDEVVQVIRDIGTLLGRPEQATALGQDLRQELDEVRSGLPATPRPTIFLFGTTQAFLVIAPWTYAGDLLRLAGGQNLAADIVSAYQHDPGYELGFLPLSLEELLVTEPEVICVLSHGDPQAVTAALSAELGSHPAWQELSAVQRGRVHVMPATLFSADPGLNFPQAVRLLSEVLHERQP